MFPKTRRTGASSKVGLKRVFVSTSTKSKLSEKPDSKIKQYELRHYLWRSLLTFACPMFVLGLYGFIGIFYLQYPPSNGIVSGLTIDGRRLFYGWFILAILSLEWGRVGLANIEAAVLMRRRLAPRTALQLMWHVDANWANFLWWLKGLRSTAFWLLHWQRRPQVTAIGPRSTPNMLWVLLSFTSALLFIAVSMSGLSIELTDAKVPSNSKAQIFGPNSTTFNTLASDIRSKKININWLSGRKTSPQNGAIFYAPDQTFNVSTTYFDDQAAQNATAISVFVGPAVGEDVIGTAWGISANISCRPAPANELQLIRVHGLDSYDIKGCAAQFLTDLNTVEKCHLGWLNTRNASVSMAWPSWMNDSAYDFLAHNITSSMLAITDGASGAGLDSKISFVRSHYSEANGHDKWTFDSLQNSRSADKATTAMFEFYLWQPSYLSHADSLLSKWPISIYQPIGSTSFHGTTLRTGSIGFGLHCDVNTATGTAALDPSQRTFSRFSIVHAKPSSNLSLSNPEMSPNAGPCSRGTFLQSSIWIGVPPFTTIISLKIFGNCLSTHLNYHCRYSEGIECQAFTRVI